MPRLHGFTKKRLLEIYELMVMSRKLDGKMLNLLKQGKSFFHTGVSGHEATQLAAAEVLCVGKDWAYPYYRDGAFCLGLGMTCRDQLLSALARGEDPNSAGRQMPGHYSSKEKRIVTQSSATGLNISKLLDVLLLLLIAETKKLFMSLQVKVLLARETFTKH